MALKQKHFIIHGSSTMPDNSTDNYVGGPIDLYKKITWAPLGSTGILNVVSESSNDTYSEGGPHVTVYGRNSAGELVNENIFLNGSTAVAGSIQFERILKATLSTAPVGTVALYRPVALHHGVSSSVGSDYLQIKASASPTHALHDTAFQFHVLVATSTLTASTTWCREIVKFNYQTGMCDVRDWPAAMPQSTETGVRVYEGMIFDISGYTHTANVTECRRPFYNAAADPTGGGYAESRTYHEKLFMYNRDTSQALTNATISEVSEGGYALIDFYLDSALDSDGVNHEDGNGREIFDTAIVGSSTFDSTQKNVANSQNLSTATGQGVWLRLTLDSGAAAQNTFYKLQLQGQST